MNRGKRANRMVSREQRLSWLRERMGEEPANEATKINEQRASVLALEMNAAKLPIWTPSRASRRPGGRWVVGTYMGDVVGVEEPNGSLTVRDACLQAHIDRRYAALGFPPERHVRLATCEVAGALGCRSTGNAPGSSLGLPWPA